MVNEMFKIRLSRTKSGSEVNELSRNMESIPTHCLSINSEEKSSAASFVGRMRRILTSESRTSILIADAITSVFPVPVKNC